MKNPAFLVLLITLIFGMYLSIRPNPQPAIPTGDVKITIHMTDGSKKYPSKVFVRQGYVQAIYPSGDAITYQWDLIDSVSSK